MKYQHSFHCHISGNLRKEVKSQHELPRRVHLSLLMHRYLLIQQTVDSVQSPEGVPPPERQSALVEQTPCKPQSPIHDCLVEGCFLFLSELKGIIGGRKKTKNNNSSLIYILFNWLKKNNNKVARRLVRIWKSLLCNFYKIEEKKT